MVVTAIRFMVDASFSGISRRGSQGGRALRARTRLECCGSKTARYRVQMKDLEAGTRVPYLFRVLGFVVVDLCGNQRLDLPRPQMICNIPRAGKMTWFQRFNENTCPNTTRNGLLGHHHYLCRSSWFVTTPQKDRWPVKPDVTETVCAKADIAIGGTRVGEQEGSDRPEAVRHVQGRLSPFRPL